MVVVGPKAAPCVCFQDANQAEGRGLCDASLVSVWTNISVERKRATVSARNRNRNRVQHACMCGFRRYSNAAKQWIIAIMLTWVADV